MSEFLHDRLKWEQRQRLILLEATVFWSGEISTASLVEFFGISRVQASKDLSLYQSLCPGNIFYDNHIKRYVVDEAFKPFFMEGSTGELLLVLKLQQQKDAKVMVALVGNLPSVEIVNPLGRQIDELLMRSVVRAIRFNLEIEITYQSMTSHELATLKVVPYTLVFDGLQWHLRAYSIKESVYRDFVLARIYQVTILGKAEEPPFLDGLWEAWVSVEIGPHPGLSEMHKSVVERDYGMVDGKCVTKVRAALLPYFLLCMRIAKDDSKRDPLLQKIVLLNRKELKGLIRASSGL
ncbi:MAG: WYL domain-containing protein [Methylicorpusculum sp.]|uniref:WYL domain-containing protein n=1 Tax=Methylicorpusculum sp. TaxID=2713644 RepID=UPI00271A1E81|nr:WYL domain-containing protein [Methylicorpusculum sp.]MDO8939534.1 WYL domain-containing protein [Methylicorpusculum sp.]MDP2204562.1 WYL domain-containing protein [Methylicorpusculum sp.]